MPPQDYPSAQVPCAIHQAPIAPASIAGQQEMPIRRQPEDRALRQRAKLSPPQALFYFGQGRASCLLNPLEARITIGKTLRRSIRIASTTRARLNPRII